MLFFSADNSEVEEVSREFGLAGIRCEIRSGPHGRGIPVNPAPSELWIHDDRDCHRALMLCVQLGLGFAKRPRRQSLFDPDPEESVPDANEAGEAGDMQPPDVRSRRVQRAGRN